MCAVVALTYLGARQPIVEQRIQVAPIWLPLGEFVCTRYCDQGLGKHKWDDGLTKSLTPVRYGVVAVDPKIIPLGSKLKIAGFYGVVFRAEDVGGKIKGKRLDIWHHNERYCVQWGRQARFVWREIK